jgi:hypothetical protein
MESRREEREKSSKEVASGLNLPVPRENRWETGQFCPRGESVLAFAYVDKKVEMEISAQSGVGTMKFARILSLNSL